MCNNYLGNAIDIVNIIKILGEEMNRLAINGCNPVRTEMFPDQANVGAEEMIAASRVIKTGMLSAYRGNAQKYRGGKEIQALENMWQEMFQVPHAIACNSCTSALHIALGAIGIKPGDEVIVTPYSMTCSATAPLLWGGVPVFADVEPDNFCLDPASVEKAITEKTKAIIVVDLFGQPYNASAINEIAKKYGLYVIEDAAQALGSKYTDAAGVTSYTGSLGDIGCFSMTQGKHITAGEGGMMTTKDPLLAERCRLIMNHAEAIIHDMDRYKTAIMKSTSSHKLWGFNMRMTEVTAAIAQAQLKKLPAFIEARRANAARISEALCKLPMITDPGVRKEGHHTYYCQPFLYDRERAQGVHRDRFIDAVKAELTPMKGREEEGVRIGAGYITPLYRMPVFTDYDTEPKVKLLTVETLWLDKLFLHLYLAPPTTVEHCEDIAAAFHKVADNLNEL